METAQFQIMNEYDAVRAKIPQQISQYEKDILEYAVNAYYPVLPYSEKWIDGKAFADAIDRVYDPENPRTAEVLRILRKN